MSRKPIKSDRCIKSLKVEGKEYNVPVEGCKKLLLTVETKGTKTWHFRYTHPHNKKLRPKLSLGQYPAVSLADAKELWLNNNRLLSQGIDPKGYHLDQARVAAEKNSNTFGVISKQWEAWQAQTVSQSTITGNKRYLGYARLELADIPIADVTSSMILAVCKEWEAKGNHETAKRIKLNNHQLKAGGLV